MAVMLLSLVPPVSRDALVHHLAVPKLYLENGGFFQLPCMSYSYYPMNLDLLYMGALYLGSDILPKLIHFFFGLMTAALIYNYISKRINVTWALFGAFLFLSLPIIIKLSITVYVDLGLVFFSTASLLAIIKWIETDFKIKHLFWAGAWCGLAMGTKYNGLIIFFLLSLFAPFLYSRCRGNASPLGLKSIVPGLVFALTALVFFSPWMIRNYVWTRNPVYPLYNQHFKVHIEQPCVSNWKIANAENSNTKDFHFGNLAYRKFIYGEKWWEMLLLPVRIFFQGRDNDFQFFDGRLSALLLLLPMFSFVSCNGRDNVYLGEKKIMLSFSILFILFTLFSSVIRMRYLSPAIPFLVILSVYGLKNAMSSCCIASRWVHIRKKGSYFLIFLVSFYLLWFHGGYLVEQFKYVKPLSYICGDVSRNAYIRSFRHEYAAFEYINKHLPLNANIMFFYIGKRGYYCNRKYVPDEGENIKLLYGLLRTYHDPWKITQEFQNRGITFFLINNALFKERIGLDLNHGEQVLFFDFITHWTENIFDHNGFSLYQIKAGS